MAVTALDQPDFRIIADFRKRHLPALAGLPVQVLQLCQEAGPVQLVHVALDGTSRCGDEMPDWMADRQRRLEKITEAKEALEAQARAEAASEESEDPAPPKDCEYPAGSPRGQRSAQFHRSAEPHHEGPGRLHSGIQRPGCRG